MEQQAYHMDRCLTGACDRGCYNRASKSTVRYVSINIRNCSNSSLMQSYFGLDQIQHWLHNMTIIVTTITMTTMIIIIMII